MDLEGLEQYFSIGPALKKEKQKLKIYNRDFIGQFYFLALAPVTVMINSII